MSQTVSFITACQLGQLDVVQTMYSQDTSLLNNTAFRKACLANQTNVVKQMCKWDATLCRIRPVWNQMTDEMIRTLHECICDAWIQTLLHDQLPRDQLPHECICTICFQQTQDCIQTHCKQFVCFSCFTHYMKHKIVQMRTTISQMRTISRMRTTICPCCATNIKIYF